MPATYDTAKAERVSDLEGHLRGLAHQEFQHAAVPSRTNPGRVEAGVTYSTSRVAASPEGEDAPDRAR